MSRYTVMFIIAAIIVSTGAGIHTHSSTFPLSLPSSPASTPVKNVTVSEFRTNRLTSVNFEDSISRLYRAIGLEKAGLKYDVFRYGMIGYHSLHQEGKAKGRIMSFIDFTRKSTEKRFYTVDLDQKAITFHSLVSHGRNTGENEATKFSNTPHSNQSSLGFYVTGETYIGSKGYSLRLDGADGVYNDNMRDRAVVMHDAEYVSEEWIQKNGRLGRSQGCPALPKNISRKVIDTIKGGTVIFAYFHDDEYLRSSTHLQLEKVFQKLDALHQVTETL